jgi:hypothetical protein
VRKPDSEPVDFSIDDIVFANNDYYTKTTTADWLQEQIDEQTEWLNLKRVMSLKDKFRL